MMDTISVVVEAAAAANKHLPYLRLATHRIAWHVDDAQVVFLSASPSENNQSTTHPRLSNDQQ
jgi:hypothetical protein